MKNWRNSEPFLNRDGGCRRCSGPSRLHKIKEAVSKAANKLRSLWNRKKREHSHDENK